MAENQTKQHLRAKQRLVKELENITDPEKQIVIYDYQNGDRIIVKRKDILSFGYSDFSDKSYLSFVLPFMPDGGIIEYKTYSRTTPIVKSGETLHNFTIDKDVDIYAL